MGRTARASVGGVCYHAINRGNGRARVFHEPDDYEAFVDLLAASGDRVPVRVVAFCLMPNHFHLLLWPRRDGDLGRFMQWLLTAHVRRHHRRHDSSGHVWQGRFKAFPIQQDGHLLTVRRYIERNPVRARLARRAEAWKWSSLAGSPPGSAWPFLHPGPVELPGRWVEEVNGSREDEDLDRLRASVNRGAPYGTRVWSRRTAARLGIEPSLRPLGRPPKLPGTEEK